MLLGLGEDEYEYYDANESGEDVNIDFIDDQSLEDFAKVIKPILLFDRKIPYQRIFRCPKAPDYFFSGFSP